MSNWQPIETAPYSEKFMATDGKDILAPCFREKAGIISQDGFYGWWQCEENDFFVRINPTHWQPLPDPPQLDATPQYDNVTD